MTSGTIGSGFSPYTTYSTKSWAGADDPLNKALWNSYSMSARSNYSDGAMAGSCNNHWGPSISFTDDDELRLQDKLASAARGHEFNAAVFLGQSREVASSIVGTYTAFRGIKRSLLKGDLQGAMRFLSRSVSGADARAAKKKLDTRDLAGTHLSLVYGWLPLLSDVHAAAGALEVLANPPRRSSITVSRSRSQTFEASQSPTLYTCEGNRRVSRRITYEMVEEMSGARSLGLLDPASVAWELTPYSFVVDWFVPIGTYLSNLAVIPNLKGSFKAQTKVKGSYSGCSSTTEDPYYKGKTARGSEINFSRHPVAASLSTPLPVFRGLGQLFDSTARSLNAIALLRNLYK